MVVYVLCQNIEQFKSFCHEYNTNPRNPNFRFLDRYDKLRGIGRGAPVLLYGTPYKREDMDEIEDVMKAIEAVILKG